MTIPYPRCTVLNFLELFQYYLFKQVQIRFRGFASFWTPNSNLCEPSSNPAGFGFDKGANSTVWIKTVPFCISAVEGGISRVSMR